MSSMDHSPVENTCPLIDEVISVLSGVVFPEDSWYDEKMVGGIMEQIRRANSTLREWGNEQYNRAEDLENELEELRREKEDLEEELEKLTEEEHE